MIATPPTTSLWPPMYFVVEWTTTSAPERERLLKIRRRERVVDRDELGPAGCAAPRSRGDVDELEQRVGRRLDPEELRVRAEPPRAPRRGRVMST